MTTRRILDERARHLARVAPAAPAAGDTLGIVTFRLGGERYALESRYLLEIVRVTNITPVPGVPEHFAGVTNVRGEILALVDLRRFFGLPVKGVTDLSRILVLGLQRKEVGLLADAVDEVSTLNRHELLAPPDPARGIGLDHLLGVTRDALIVLDAAALLGDPRLSAGRSADVPGTRWEPS